MADRTEKLQVTRTHAATQVKVSLVEDGISVSYTVKTYESQIAGAVKSAKAGAARLHAEALDGLTS